MGIQGLVAFLQKKVPDAIEAWTGVPVGMRAKVAVDATLYMCRLFYADDSIRTSDDLARAYLSFHDSLVAKRFDPVHVYDGPTLALKRFAHTKRSDARD